MIDATNLRLIKHLTDYDMTVWYYQRVSSKWLLRSSTYAARVKLDYI